jgi:TetR/AcrR family transcriptional regulator, transcriptional repressor for nem operon
VGRESRRGQRDALLTRPQAGHATDHKQDTRRRILRSAARLFNRKGFSEATIDEIMTAAGLTHGGFYRHFSSKDKLYADAVRLSFPKIPSGLDSHRKAESSHH